MKNVFVLLALLGLSFGSSLAQSNIDPNQLQTSNGNAVTDTLDAVVTKVSPPSNPDDPNLLEIRLSNGQSAQALDDVKNATVGDAIKIVPLNDPASKVGYVVADINAQADLPTTYLEGKVLAVKTDIVDGERRDVLEVQLPSKEKITAIDDIGGFRVGDSVEIFQTWSPEDKKIYYASDQIRRNSLWWPFLLFVLATGLIGRVKGLRAVLSMLVSLAVLMLVIVPLITQGFNPVVAVLGGAALILCASVYFVHGINWTSSSALVATIVAAAVTLLLAALFANLARLTGFGSEEARFILNLQPNINMYNLLLAGMIVSSLGALVDSTVAQAAVVRELSRLGPELSWRQLYAGGMSVGFDHIGSLVNTLVLAYAGASLPLFVLFTLSDFGVGRALNQEYIASDIVSALVGSTGLVLAVPIATALAAFLFAGNKRPMVAAETTMHQHGWRPPADQSALEIQSKLNPPKRERSGLLEALGEDMRAGLQENQKEDSKKND